MSLQRSLGEVSLQRSLGATCFIKDHYRLLNLNDNVTRDIFKEYPKDIEFLRMNLTTVLEGKISFDSC